MYKHVIFISSTSFLYHGRFAFRKISTVVKNLLQNCNPPKKICTQIWRNHLPTRLFIKFYAFKFQVIICRLFLRWRTRWWDWPVSGPWGYWLWAATRWDYTAVPCYNYLWNEFNCCRILLALTVLSKNAVACIHS